MGRYVEPSGYFTPSMKRILKEGETKSTPKTGKTPATKTPKKSTKKSLTILLQTLKL